MDMSIFLLSIILGLQMAQASEAIKAKAVSIELPTVAVQVVKQPVADLERWMELMRLVDDAVKERDWVAAERYAKEYLQMARVMKGDWNYGNAIYDGNMALSQVAYAKNDMSGARSFLLKASQTPGSPQLNSFGPFNSLEVGPYLDELKMKGETRVLMTFAENLKKHIGSALKKESQREIAEHDEVRSNLLASFDRFISQIPEKESFDFLWIQHGP